MRSVYRQRLLASTLFVVTAAATPALAQDSAPADQAAPADESQPQEVLVTGSRILVPGAVSASPLQSVGAAQIQEAGAINVQEVLLQNPTFGSPGISRTNSSFATQSAGVATVNLRNLGEDRTLVLVNGRRFVSGVPGSNAVDLNVIPTQFLERVDILTGGSSAVYGSDAVAGVVNLLYKTDFEGVQVDGQMGISEYGDGADKQVNLLVGKNFAGGRGNIMLFGGYSKEGTVLKRDRFTEAGSSAIDRTSGTLTPNDPFVLLSGFTPGGRFYAGDSVFTYGSNNQLRDCTGVSCGGFNRSDYRYLAVPVERYVADALYHCYVLRYDS